MGFVDRTLVLTFVLSSPPPSFLLPPLLPLFSGNYVKDLSVINRDLRRTIIIDNSSSSFIFHPESAIGCGSFIDDKSDRELVVIGDYLEELATHDDFRGRCDQWKGYKKGKPIAMKKK